jgi:hypothetical protein
MSKYSLRKGFPKAEKNQCTKSSAHRRNDRNVIGLLVLLKLALVYRERLNTYSGVDDSNESQADTRDDEQGTNVVDSLQTLLPRNSTRVLWRVVETEQSYEGEELSAETTPIDTLPVTRIDGILGVVSIPSFHGIVQELTRPTTGPMMTMTKTNPSLKQIPM